MRTIKLTDDYFNGSGKVWDRQKGIGVILRSLARDNARTRFIALAPSKLTDSTGGNKASAGDIANVLTGASVDATNGGGVQLSSFNGSLTKVRNVEAVIVTDLNALLAVLGLPAISGMEGSVVTAHTLPALDVSAQADSGAATVSFASFVAAYRAGRQNYMMLVAAFNAVAVAIGVPKLVSPVQGSSVQTMAIQPILPCGPAQASPNGFQSAAVPVATAWLAALANDYAALAAAFNAVFDPQTGSLAQKVPLAVVAA